MSDRLDSDNRLLRKIAEATVAAGAGVSSAVNTALNLKEDVANKDTDTVLGNSDVRYPSQLAAKTFLLDIQSESHDYVDNLVLNHSDIPFSGTPVIEFTGTPYQTITLEGDATFSTGNLSAAHSIIVRIIGDISNSYDITFPAGWIFIGTSPVAPISVAVNEIVLLTITAFGTTDADVIAMLTRQA